MKRKPQHSIELADGRTIRFSIKSRSDTQSYLVVFMGPDQRRLERSTKELSQKRALDAAAKIIREEFQQKVNPTPLWDEAIIAVIKAMEANNNRPATIADYENTLQTLRQFFPACRGPAEITTQLAKQFKVEYLTRKYTRRKPSEPKVWKGIGRKPKLRPDPPTYSRTARTLDSRLRKLRVIWGRWFNKELGYFSENPWRDVSLPKLDKLTPRYLTPNEINHFFEWFKQRWEGWRLPVLFFTVKLFIGNRILELCSLRSEQLKEGRIVFPPNQVKGRKGRSAILPPSIFAELQALSGKTFLWENFPRELLERMTALQRPCNNLKSEFVPRRLKWWLQGEIDDFCKSHPEVERFSAHAFRKRAMTEAWRLGIQPEKAAIAFGCNVKTMMAHYIALDEVATADEVLSAVAQAVVQQTRFDTL